MLLSGAQANKGPKLPCQPPTSLSYSIDSDGYNLVPNMVQFFTQGQCKGPYLFPNYYTIWPWKAAYSSYRPPSFEMRVPLKPVFKSWQVYSTPYRSEYLTLHKIVFCCVIYRYSAVFCTAYCTILSLYLRASDSGGRDNEICPYLHNPRHLCWLFPPDEQMLEILTSMMNGSTLQYPWSVTWHEVYAQWHAI